MTYEEEWEMRKQRPATVWGSLGILLVALLSFASAGRAQVVSFATLKPGSLYHTMGTVVAKVVTQKTGMRMLVQPLGNDRATMTALSRGQAEFAWADINSALIATGGKFIYEGRMIKGLRLAANVQGVPVGVFVRKSSGITTMEQLKGKRFPSDYPAFPNGVPLMQGILAAANMTYDDVVKVPVQSLIPGVDDFIAGKIDVGFFAAGGPKVAEADSAVGGVRFIGLPNTPEADARVKKVRPAYYIDVVQPAPFRAGIDGPTPLMVFDQVLLAGTHVSDKMVFEVLDTMVKYRDELIKGFRPFGAFIPKKMGKQYPGIEPHPGAVKFLKEKGFWKDM